MRVVPILVVVLALLLGTSTASLSTAPAENPVTVMSGVFLNPHSGLAMRRNFCTAFAIKVKKNVVKWVTAYHCVDSLPERVDLHIGNSPATVIMANPGADLAVLDGGPAIGFKVATRTPDIGDDLTIIGHPGGWDTPILRKGLFSGMFDVRENGTQTAIFQLPVAGGDSGSPIFNSRMQVVGVMQISFCGGSGFCPLSGGATLAYLQAIVSVL